MYYFIPGIPPDSIFFYPVNLPIQLVIYFLALLMVMWSDVIIMIVIMYCDAELRTIAEFIEILDGGKDFQMQEAKYLRIIYEKHQTISEKANQLTLSFWHVYFQKLFSIMLYLCVLIFIFQSADSSIFVPLLACCLMITQIFILCFFGQIIWNSSEKMSQALYMTTWYEMSLRNQKNLLMLMTRFNLPIKVETFGFGDISYYTFVQICKASLSYATILYTVFM
uniref:Uncharacterized protein n=1 Tax=Lutzomyia longipalpis TaxID=7200 RepID=A0A3F2ZDF5_LUTLO